MVHGLAKLSGRDYEFQEPTLRRESTVKRENLRGESHGDRAEFRPEESEEDAEARKEFWSFKDDSFVVIILNRDFNLRAERRIVPYFTRFTLLNETPPRRNIRCGERIGKARTFEAKTNSIVLILQGRTECCTLLQLCARIRSDEKILRKLFTWFLLKVKASTCCLVSRHSVSVRQHSSSKPQNPAGVYEILSSVNLGRKKYELRTWFWSANFGNRELRMVQKTVSQRRMPRETEMYE